MRGEETVGEEEEVQGGDKWFCVQWQPHSCKIVQTQHPILQMTLHRLFVCFWFTDGVVGMVEWVGPACDGERQGREEVL